MADQFTFTQKRIEELASPSEGRMEYADTAQSKLRIPVSHRICLIAFLPVAGGVPLGHQSGTNSVRCGGSG